MIGHPMFQTSPHRLKSCFSCWKWCFPHDFQVFNYSIFESLSVDINSLNFFIFLVVTIISLAILAGWYCRYCIYFFDTYWTTWHLFKGGSTQFWGIYPGLCLLGRLECFIFSKDVYLENWRLETWWRLINTVKLGLKPPVSYTRTQLLNYN